MKKTSLYFLVVFFTSFLLSQNFDENYLQSLPDDIREDIENQINDREESEKPIYRNDSSRTEKLKDEKVESDEPKIFGQDFFTSFQSSYMPINEPNFDSEYILDYGDVLKIQLTGQEESIEEYEISREGYINIPVIGRITLSGMSLAQASSKIQSRVEKSYVGTKTF